MRRHPLARALRVDKLTLAALEATLRGPATPTATALHEPVERLRDRAGRLAARLAATGLDARVVDSDAVVGGGGAPGVRLPSAAVSLPATLGSSLRKGQPAVAGRIEDGRLLLDLRTVDPADDDLLRAAVLGAAAWPGLPAQPAAGSGRPGLHPDYRRARPSREKSGHSRPVPSIHEPFGETRP